VECLSSYVTRLARLHYVSSIQLVGLAYHLYSDKKNYIPSLSLLNGSSDAIELVIKGLERLTGRNDIRYLGTRFWKGIIGGKYLVRNKQWCPSCFHEWKEKKLIFYEPLIW
jgi:hypothetical protein